MNKLRFIACLRSLSWATALSSVSAILAVTPAFADGHLLVYGDRGYNVFLGCVTCGEFNPNAMDNEFSRYGSEFSPTSIFNQFGRYGSEFSDESVCNPRASYPPALVDEDGNFYGYLTVDFSRRDAVEIPQIQGLIIGICKH